MKIRIMFSLLIFAMALLAADSRSAPQPRYDPALVVDWPVTLTEVRDNYDENGLSGVWLLTRTETDAPLDVYLGPAAYVKQFEISFAKGDRLQVIGSKVKVAGSSLVLAREVRKGSATLYLRDRDGNPFWR